MGGDGQVYSDTFRVGAGKVLIGDADQDGFVCRCRFACGHQ